MKTRWIVSQIGARQHYGLPRGFVYNGELRALYTEFWCRWGAATLRKGNSAMRALAGRYHPDIPNSKVVSFNISTMWDSFAHRMKNPTMEETFLEFLRFGKKFSSAVAEHLRPQELDGERDIFSLGLTPDAWRRLS